MVQFFYSRVSTADQHIEHQKIQAEAAGFKIDRVVADDAVSGVTTRFADRPNGRRLFDMLREGDTLVVRWVDRLGRDYSDVRDTVQEFMRRGVVVRTVINGLTFDGATRDPMQQAVRDALIGFLAATAQANAEAIKEAQKGGIALARSREGQTKYRGRKPSFTFSQLRMVREMLAQSAGIGTIAKCTGLSRQTVYRIRDDPAAAEAVLINWGDQSVAF
jgi:putative DNA-invertase from lambdoid prophage Rac